MARPSLLLATTVFLCYSAYVYSKKPTQIDSLSYRPTWPRFFKEYVRQGRSVVIVGECKDNKAYRLWSADYIRYHPGAAITFRNLTTTKESVSMRKMIERREEIGKLRTKLPEFLSMDLKVPDFLECRVLEENINNPTFLWHLKDAKDQLFRPPSHEVWCLLRGSIQLSLIPDVPERFFGQFLTDQSFSSDPELKDIQLQSAEANGGDCFYIPAGVPRQYEASQDSMAVVYEIPESVLKRLEPKLVDCPKAEPSSWVEFADEDIEDEGAVKHSLELTRFISYLGKSDCIDFPLFWDSIANDPDLRWLDRKSTREPISEEIFEAMDKDHDGQLCWTDIDMLTLETATQLAQSIKRKQLILESGLDISINRKAARKIKQLNVNYDDPQFLETMSEVLREQYGDKLGNIFSGPWIEEMNEEARAEKDSEEEKKHGYHSEL